MSNAYHAARRLNFALQGTWFSCQKTNVYNYLFGPIPTTTGWTEDIPYDQTNLLLKLHNEIQGYATVSRSEQSRFSAQTKPSSSSAAMCDTCHEEKIASDYEFYSSLMQQFGKKHLVHEFVNRHEFANHTVIGMHIRAGNGEGGDFTHKGRGIANETAFVQTVSHHIQSLIVEGNWKDPPLLFIATDTPGMVQMFRDTLHEIMTTKDSNSSRFNSIKVVDLPQIRPSEGAGILFGEKKRKHDFQQLTEEEQEAEKEANGEQSVARRLLAKESIDSEDDEEYNEKMTCLLGWDQAFMDMMILAASDVVIATRRSSFVQTIPLSMVVGKPKEQRKVLAPYCEISQDSTLNMTCHETYMDWCCCAECIQQEEEERQQTNPQQKRNSVSEYVKQLRPDLWKTPVMELYQKQLKTKTHYKKLSAAAYFS